MFPNGSTAYALPSALRFGNALFEFGAHAHQAVARNSHASVELRSRFLARVGGEDGFRFQRAPVQLHGLGFAGRAEQAHDDRPPSSLGFRPVTSTSSELSFSSGTLAGFAPRAGTGSSGWLKPVANREFSAESDLR